MNLIITPYYKARKELIEMVNAIDKFSHYPFLHVIVGDNSKPPPVNRKNRIVLNNTYEEVGKHRNQAGKALQIAYEVGKSKVSFDYLFLVENDVIVRKDWDKKMIDDIPDLPKNWATLDVVSVDKSGNITYPTTVNVPTNIKMGRFLQLEYTDFQSTLFNPKVLKLNWRFDEVDSHFDILISRKITELSGRIHLRDPNIEVLHYPYSSRKYLK